jgi:hypothetical protein
MSHKLLAAALAFAAFPALGQDEGALAAEIERLQRRVAALEERLRERDAALAELAAELRALAGIVEAKPVLGVAAPFLAAPPAASDLVGVARAAVFAPRLAVDARVGHDTLFVRLRRIEADRVVTVAEAELTQDMADLELRLDRSGALYALEWWTAEGHSLALALRDGATALPAATAQVKPQDARGRFLFVGYRLD